MSQGRSASPTRKVPIFGLPAKTIAKVFAREAAKENFKGAGESLVLHR
jgi:hypothetical protein